MFVAPRQDRIAQVDGRFQPPGRSKRCNQFELDLHNAVYIAAAARTLARSLGLQPINTPVCSPQSNGMAKSFVNTFKRDYVARMDRRDAQTVLAQLPAAFEHFNEAHPLSSLKMRSAREFRRQEADQVRPEPLMDPALYCD